MSGTPSDPPVGQSPEAAAGAAVPAVTARRGGRPSRIEAQQLRERILDAAAALFFTDGYGATTIEEVARRARISKRTLYHRFDDKAALFRAVVHRSIDRLRPPPHVPLLDGATLQDVLQRLAGLILRGALSAPGIALHRLIVAESARFPELAAVVTDQGGTNEAVLLIAGVLEREACAGRLALNAPNFAAQQFLHLVVAWPQRRAMGLGQPMTPDELDAWVRDSVNLFLNGCRGWMPKQP